MTRVVVIDDDAEFRLIVRSLLERMGDAVVVVGEAADGEEGLALVRHERPEIVITDLVMPRLDGIELTRRIRQELPHTKICLISSYTEDAYRSGHQTAEPTPSVNKRVISSALVPAVRDLIRRRETPCESQPGCPP